MDGESIVLGAPVVSPGVLGQTHALVGDDIVLGAPVVGPSDDFGQNHTMSGGAVVTGDVVVPTGSVSPDQSALWPFPWNWKSGLSESLEFRTEVIKSRSGKEQRRALRQTPRRAFEGSIQAKRDRFRVFSRLMATRIDRHFDLQYPMQSAELATDLDTLTRTFSITAASTWVVTGARGLLITPDYSEIVEFESVTGLDVTISGVAFYTWPAGSKLFRLFRARLDTRIATKQETNTILQANIRFEEEPGLYAELYEEVPGLTYKGRELWMKKPNWATTPTIEFQSNREPVDFGIGRAENFYPIDFNGKVIKATYTGRTKLETYGIMDFFRRLYGQQGEFYMPTWTDDLSAAQALTGSTLYIVGKETYFAYRNDTMHKAIVVWLRDGTYLLRTIASMAWTDTGGEFTVFTLDEAWPSTIPVSDIRSISWLPVWRMVGDRLTVDWLTTEVAQMAIPVMMIENLEVEP